MYLILQLKDQWCAAINLKSASNSLLDLKMLSAGWLLYFTVEHHFFDSLQNNLLYYVEEEKNIYTVYIFRYINTINCKVSEQVSSITKEKLGDNTTKHRFR